MRADRLLSLVLLLQARGRATAQAIAAELEVSVRTIYRDLEALVAAGVPVLTESGPGGGCRLMEGYRFPLRGLRPDQAEALLILGVPGVLRELGLDAALDAAQRQIRVTAGNPHLNGAALVHLDMPRWFGSQEDVPCLRDLARALRSGRRLAFGYRAPGEASEAGEAGEADEAELRVVGPLGLVNKAGLWYLVAVPSGGAHDRSGTRVFRVARIVSARPLAEPFERPAGFDLAAFWRQWSAEFEASRPRLPVTLRASPRALAILGEVFGQAAEPALAAALPPDEHGWRVLTLSFEHERAAAHRLAGFGDQVEVLTPPSVRAGLVATARQILGRYDAADG
ncbi:MAG: helix-turn-helix transcriptional regulator [Streptosporangiaceae bacterium]